MTTPPEGTRAAEDPSSAEGQGPEAKRVRSLLDDWVAGNPAAHEELVVLLYDKLRGLARHARRGEAAGRTLATTALVNEAYLRLVGADVKWADQQHFLAVAARAMRRVLVDDARRRSRKKRGAGGPVVAMNTDDGRIPTPDRPREFLDLDEAIDRLLELDERKGRAVELFYFGGLSYPEVARVLEVSEATIHRELRAARAWLFADLAPTGED